MPQAVPRPGGVERRSQTKNHEFRRCSMIPDDGKESYGYRLRLNPSYGSLIELLQVLPKNFSPNLI